MKFSQIVSLFLSLGVWIFIVGCSQDETLPAELSIGVSSVEIDDSAESGTISIRNLGGSLLRWSSSTNDSWVTLSPLLGDIAPGAETTVTVSVNKSSLSSGLSFSEISIVQIGTGNITAGKVLSERLIPVEVFVQLPADLELTADNLSFANNTSSQSLTIQNAGDKSLTWSVSSNQSWLAVSPSSGTTQGGQLSSMTVTVSRGTLAPGQYNGQLSFSSNGGSGTVDVTMDVNQPVTKVLFTQYVSTDVTSGYEIYSMNSDGTLKQNLTNNSFYDNAASWSPSQNKIAFESSRSGSSSIYTMNANGTQPVQLTFGAISYDPTWAPNELKVAFSRLVSGTDNYEIFVINTNGTGQIQLTSNGASNYWPDWAPDDSKIVFCSNLDGDRDIYTMHINGTGVVKLTNNTADDIIPSFSMDSQKIVYSSNEDGDYEIYVINVDGTGKQKLTNNAFFDGYGSFSSTSDFIIFTSDRDGNRELYTMSITGGSVTRLTNTPTSEFYPDF
ncbi:MAG: DUF5050 domain-containing protein [Imperialibacter sp.]|uniref:BACON domain-containing protein n=1 Tax=Imperialibacter sp. TaxID=2038411 RepID=UPI0032EC9F4A